jgi:hypothetical protein
MPGTADLDPEDAKLLTLARATRARAGAAEAAAVRDGDGRTYVAVEVALPSLQLSAVQAVVAVAAASGQTTLEAVGVVGDAEALAVADRALLGEIQVSTILLAGPDGALRSRG